MTPQYLWWQLEVQNACQENPSFECNLQREPYATQKQRAGQTLIFRRKQTLLHLHKTKEKTLRQEIEFFLAFQRDFAGNIPRKIKSIFCWLLSECNKWGSLCLHSANFSIIFKQAGELSAALTVVPRKTHENVHGFLCIVTEKNHWLSPLCWETRCVLGMAPVNSYHREPRSQS